jgi:hypothetical protein
MRRHRGEDAHGRYPGKKQRRRIASDDDEDEGEDKGMDLDSDDDDEEGDPEQENQGHGQGQRRLILSDEDKDEDEDEGEGSDDDEEEEEEEEQEQENQGYDHLSCGKRTFSLSFCVALSFLVLLRHELAIISFRHFLFGDGGLLEEKAQVPLHDSPLEAWARFPQGKEVFAFIFSMPPTKDLPK